MARYTEASCRLCRREKVKLYLKGDRCFSEKCAITHVRPKQKSPAGAPGQHGLKNSKLSEYGTQLREKQKVKRIYGVLEKQFRHYFEMAEHKSGITGDNLLILLESRLDNIVYRMGFASSRKEARQLVLHNHFTVDGKKVNIPSYLCKPNQTVTVTEKSRKSPKFKEIMENGASRSIPDYLSADFENMTGTVLNTPNKSHIEIPIEEHLIVELYSK